MIAHPRHGVGAALISVVQPLPRVAMVLLKSVMHPLGVGALVLVREAVQIIVQRTSITLPGRLPDEL